MVDTIVMNATSNGLTGITNLSMQTGTLGTIFGATMVIGILMSIIIGSHSWNTKGWLYKLVKHLMQTFGENILYGIATTVFCGSVYYIGSEISKFGEANPRFLSDLVLFIGQAVIVVIALAFIGFFTKPIWGFVYDYATGKPAKKVVK